MSGSRDDWTEWVKGPACLDGGGIAVSLHLLLKEWV